MLNYKTDLEKLKNFWNQFKQKMPLLASTVSAILILIKWLALIVILIFAVSLVYNNYQTRKFQKTEALYQKCLDKVVSLAPENFIVEGTVFQNQNQNKYSYIWVAIERPYYDRQKGHWEWALIKWVMKNDPLFCEEYNPNLIKEYVEKRLSQLKS